MALHPTGAGVIASAEALAHEMQVLVAVHALALLSVPVVVFGFVGVTRRIGWERPEALAYNFQLNQACAKVYVVGSSLAIFFWSIALIKVGTFERIVGIFGWLVALAALIGLFSGHVRMSAHGFGLIVFLEAVWILALGVSMLRAGRNGARAQVAALV